MRERPRLVITTLTHGLALAAGWWICEQLIHSNDKRVEDRTITSRIERPVRGDEMTAEEVFAVVRDSSERERQQREQDEITAEFERLIATMEVPDDLAAALELELSEWLKDDRDHRKTSPMITALMYHWSLRDLPGMMKWAEAGAGAREAVMWHCLQVFGKVAGDAGPEALAGGLSGGMSLFVAHTMAQQLGVSADMDEILALKASLSSEAWEKVQARICHTWPFEEKDLLVNLAMAESQPTMLLEFAKRNGAEGTRWLSGLIADGELDPGFLDSLKASEGWKEQLRSNSGMPLDDRITQLRESDGSTDVIGRIAQQDVAAQLKSGRDWKHAFRNGVADATEVLEAISKELPELAARAPDELRNQLFIQLAEEDPDRAMGLLEGLSEEEKAMVAIQAPLQAFMSIDPNQFLAALANVPSTSPELWDLRLDAWNSRTGQNYARLSEDYVDWVLGMPAGLDREMALYSLAKTVTERDARLAADLQAAMSDPRLIERLEGSR